MVERYPYVRPDRLAAARLNTELELSPGPTPPASAHKNSGQFKLWFDTSVFPNILRMCLRTGGASSPSYIPSEWHSLMAIDEFANSVTWVSGGGSVSGYLPLTGGQLVGPLSVDSAFPSDTLANVLYAGVVSANNYLFNCYYDNTVHVKRLVDGASAILTYGNGVFYFQLEAGGPGGAAPSFANPVRIDANGVSAQNFMIGGNTAGEFGNVGFINGQGPLIQIHGNSQIAGGRLDFITGGVLRAYVAGDGTVYVQQNLSVGGYASCNEVRTNYGTVYGNLAVNQDLSVLRNVTINNNLTASGACNFSGINTNTVSSANLIYGALDVQAGRTLLGTNLDVNYALVRSNSNSAIQVDAGGITAARLYIGTTGSFGGSADNTVWAPNGGVTAKAFRIQGDPDFYLVSQAGPSKILNFAPSVYFGWDSTTGNYNFIRGVNVWQIRATDNFCWNPSGSVGGASFIIASDRRLKEDIQPTERGLTEILALNPVEFKRAPLPVVGDIPPKEIPPIERPMEIGFIAQEVAAVLPEAVRVIGMELADGTGGLESAEPTLGMTDSTIVATMVNAIKEINARLVALEGGGTP